MSAPEQVVAREESLEAEVDRMRATLELIVGHANAFANIVGQDSKVSRRIATGAVDVMAGLAEEALGR